MFFCLQEWCSPSSVSSFSVRKESRLWSFSKTFSDLGIWFGCKNSIMSHVVPISFKVMIHNLIKETAIGQREPCEPSSGHQVESQVGRIPWPSSRQSRHHRRMSASWEAWPGKRCRTGRGFWWMSQWGNGDKKPDLPICTHYFDGPNGLVLSFTNLWTVFCNGDLMGFKWFLCRPSFSNLGFVPSPIFKTGFCAEPHSQNWVLCRVPFSKSGFVPSPHLKRWFCDEAVFVMKHFVPRSPPKFWFCAEWRCR